MQGCKYFWISKENVCAFINIVYNNNSRRYLPNYFSPCRYQRQLYISKQKRSIGVYASQCWWTYAELYWTYAECHADDINCESRKIIAAAGSGCFFVDYGRNREHCLHNKYRSLAECQTLFCFVGLPPAHKICVWKRWIVSVSAKSWNSEIWVYPVNGKAEKDSFVPGLK